MEQLTKMDKKEVIYTINGEEIKLTGSMVKQYLTRGTKQASDQEVLMFLSLCKYQKLNPFLNEAYLVKFGNDAQIVVGKEAYFKRAEKDKNYNGYEAGIIVIRKGEVIELDGCFKLKDDELVGGWAKVYRKDREKPSVAKVSLEEYDKKQAEWKSRPSTMIRKVALVQALREAFPDSLGALYTEEEVGINNQKNNIQEEISEQANSEEIDIKNDVVDVEYQELDNQQREHERPDF